MKKIIEDEKLAHNIMEYKKGMSQEEIEKRANVIEEKFAFNKKIILINKKLIKLLQKIRQDKIFYSVLLL